MYRARTLSGVAESSLSMMACLICAGVNGSQPKCVVSEAGDGVFSGVLSSTVSYVHDLWSLGVY